MTREVRVFNRGGDRECKPAKIIYWGEKMTERDKTKHKKRTAAGKNLISRTDMTANEQIKTKYQNVFRGQGESTKNTEKKSGKS